MGWRAYCGEIRRCTGVSPNRVYLPGYSGPQGLGMDTQRARHLFGYTPTLGHRLLSRRLFLGAGLAAAGAGLLAACAPAPAAAPSATAPAGSGAPASTPARPAQSTGELKMAV